VFFAFVGVTNPGGNRRISVKVHFLLLLSLAPACGSIAADSFTDLKGNWKGLWNIDGTNSIRFYLKITKSGETYSGAMDDLDEGYNNLPTASISNNPPYVRFDFSNVGYIYDGLIHSNFTQITGTWSNGPESWPLTFDRQPGVDEMQARIYSDASGSLPYRLFVPANYELGRKHPLVLFLHGAGERGTDNRLQITGQSGVLAFLFNENQAKQPSFLAAPQCPTSGNWVDSIRRPQLVALIAALKSEFDLDADRVYVTGLSMGGAGTWELLALNGNLFAAGIPLSGYPGTLTASATAAAAYRIPIWNFHAADDPAVAVSNSRNLIGGIRNSGGTPVYTEYASGGHVIWSASYATPLLFDWMMAQKRGVPTNVPPFVTIKSPADQPFHATARSAVLLAGTAGDSTARVSQIAWANNRGGSGTATGTNSWSVPTVALQPGANLITLMATGTAWVLAYGGNTTFSDVIQIQRTALPVLSVARTNGFAKISWAGGAAPYSLERSTNVASGTWETILTTNTNSAGVPTDQTGAHFRVRSQ
jgi:poly(3-hydroxybutyrate) depolymerase